MTLSDITNRISFLGQTDTNKFSNANRLISINAWYNKIHTMILSSQDEWDFDDSNKTDFPILTANVVASQQDYALPTNAIRIKRLEITYDNSTWYKAEPFDISERGLATDTTSISGAFTTSEPKYDLIGRSLLLYPIPTSAITNGLKIWIDRTVSEFSSSDLTTGTVSPGFDSQWHDILVLGCVYDYFMAIGKLSEADRFKREIQELELKLKSYYGSKQRDRVYLFNSAFIDYN